MIPPYLQSVLHESFEYRNANGDSLAAVAYEIAHRNEDLVSMDSGPHDALSVLTDLRELNSLCAEEFDAYRNQRNSSREHSILEAVALRSLEQFIWTSISNESDGFLQQWTEKPSEQLSGNGYTNVHYGWEHDNDPLAEVLVYSVDGTEMESMTDKSHAVQHPHDSEETHTHFFDGLEDAFGFAIDYMQSHHTPTGEPVAHPFEIVLHYPTEGTTKTVTNVISFETEWGDKNTINVEYADGEQDNFTAVGLTVSAGTH